MSPSTRRQQATAFDRVTEADWTRQVIEAAQRFGWKVAHFRPARTADGNWATAVQGDGAGFPDLILVRETTIAAELKSEYGRLSPEQEEWLAYFHNAGVETYIWRPSACEEVWARLGQQAV